MCTGPDCVITKPPSEADFDKNVYRMGGGQCYEFKTEIVKCPSSGSVEAFQHYPMPVKTFNHANFSSRTSVIKS